MSNRFHGKKRYLQVLLDPNRAELLDQLAAKLDVRSTALIREIVYEFLEQAIDADAYDKARAKDNVLWAETVRNRVEGRRNAKAQREQQQAPEKQSGLDWSGLFDRLKNRHQTR